MKKRYPLLFIHLTDKTDFERVEHGDADLEMEADLQGNLFLARVGHPADQRKLKVASIRVD